MKHRKTFLLVTLLTILISTFGFQTSTDYKILFEKAKFTMETKGDLNGAINLFNELIKKYPKEREYAAKSQLYIGLCYEKLGVKEAQKAYRKVIDGYPEQTEAVQLANEKLTLLNSSISESTIKAQQSFNLAADLFKQSEYKSAVVEYEKVIALAPKSQLAQEAQLWIGHCYFKLGNLEPALKSFNSIIKEFPESTIIPVTELMITQVQQALAEKPKISTVITVDDKTILDTATGIRYTRINSWAGKNDIIKSAIEITDISPNRKFILYENKVIPFDHSDSYTLFDTISFYHNSRLSPDGKQVAFFTKNGISVMPVSPETGRPTGPAQKLFDKTILSGFDISWSPNGESLLFSIKAEDKNISIWEFSFKDNSIKQVSNPFQYAMGNMIYSKNGLNFLYKQYAINGYFTMKMKSITGKSLTLLDSVSGQGKKFILSPDNQWIMYDKVWDKKMLYRLADKQQQEFETPEEVGDFVSWANDGNKAFFYRPSAEKKDVMKVATVFGGSAFALGAEKAGMNVGWSPDSRELLVIEGINNDDRSLKMINLINQNSKTLEGIEKIGIFPSLSPDGSKLFLGFNSSGKPTDLSIVPVSLRDYKITGKPIIIYKGFSGIPLLDYSWSPDGKKMAVCDRGEVWICNAEGGTPFQLTKTPIIENFPSWSPNGNYISIGIIATEQLQVLKSSNGEIIMTFDKVEGWEWTPDGKELTIAHQDGQLNAVSIASGKLRRIANWKEITGCTNLDDLEWSPDGNWLALNGYINGPEYITPLYLLNTIDGKAIEVQGDVKEYKELIKWSPDSKWISYYSFEGTYKNRLESILWEADLTDFMKTIKPGTETGYTTDYKIPEVPAGGVAPDGTFTDTRDGHFYKYKKIGEQTWMAENLAYLPKVNPNSDTSSVDKRYYVYGYEGSDVIAAKNTENYQKFGVLYNWPATMNGFISSNEVPSGIQGACPSGWHVPSDKEWMILEKTLGMSEDDLVKEGSDRRHTINVEKKLKSPLGWEDYTILIEQSGFNALPGGLIYLRKSQKLNQGSYFWTATSFNDLKVGARGLLSMPGTYRWTNVGKEFGNSVRCVKD